MIAALGTPEHFTRWADERLSAARAALAELLAAGGARTFENTLGPYERLARELDDASAVGSLLSEVHPDPALREAAEGAVRSASELATELSLHRGLYDAIAAVDVGDVSDASGLEPDARRLVERTLRDFRRAGVDRDEPTRARLEELARREVALGQDFDRNLREDVRSVRLDPAQLDGLPADYIAAHPPGDDGKVTITTDYPDAVPLRTYAKDGAARLALQRQSLDRGWPANDRVFRELLETRREKATLLGHRDYADYVTADKMIGSGTQVREFVERIATLSEARARRDVALLLERKQRDEPGATTVGGYESAYYEELLKRERCALDSTEVRRYFPFARVRDGLLAVTGRLFGLEYRTVPEVATWHDEVTVHDVVRTSDGAPVGRIYLDLHPRDGKYKHAAQFTVRSGTGSERLPEGALVTNFSRGLLEHDEVVTLFHEFGHLLHHLLGGGQRFVRFSGVATEWDFVEAPSQLLEEWAWDAQTLASFARHDETGAAIPADLVARMRAADELGKGAFARTQMFYASLALRYHQHPAPLELDTTAIVVEEQERLAPFPYLDGTHFQAGFGHLNGYSAMYYTYMWSLVIAKDLFSAFEQSGLHDTTTAHRYRDLVLARGGVRDAADLVADFLGRPYDFDAFRRWLDR
ncbi:MAG: peptidase M3 [Myxococcales bacterium]|nr:peptidase M3 [Myxococcales bacterium]